MSDIRVYTTPTCPWCHRVKEYLNNKGVSFQEINVAENMEEASQLVEKTGQRTVPVIEVGEEIIVGFDREKLEEIL